MTVAEVRRRLAQLAATPLRWLDRHRSRRSARATVQRLRLDNTSALLVEIVVPRSQAAAAIEALCATAGEVAASTGLNVASVGLVAGDLPLLAVRAPRRDLVADAMETHLTANETHRNPTLWLFLRHGTYVAEVLDPNLPLIADRPTVAAWIESGRVTAAVRSEVRVRRDSLVTTWEVYGATSFLRRCVRAARSFLIAAAGWEPASSTRSPGAAKNSENARLQR